MAVSTGKAARRRGGNKADIKRRTRRGKNHTYAQKVKGIRPWYMRVSVFAEE